MSSNNSLIFQCFEWYTSPGGESHYTRLARLLPSFPHLGITSLWLPPGCKANNPKGNGYDIYDLWDLGEFEQKGARETKWGNREELDELMKQARRLDIDVVWDAVINHKTGGDTTEEIWAVEVDKEDRRYEISQPQKIEAWLRFDFNGRRQTDGSLKYSEFKWRPDHFNGADWDHRMRKNAIYKLIDDPESLPQPFIQPKKQPNARRDSHPKSSRRKLTSLVRRLSSDSRTMSKVQTEPARRPGKGWADDVDKEHGNNDYLMFANIDYTHQDVREELTKWGEWMVNDVGVDGFRLDAVQHFSFKFTKDWIPHVNKAYRQHRNASKDIFLVGEVWSGDRSRVSRWLDAVQHPSGTPQVYAFDAPLLYNFSRISEDMRRRSKNLDLRTILRGSLVKSTPEAAVTLVTNHDTQPGQVCYTPMPADLKLLWYAFILLRKEGLPCVFWGDLLGTEGPHAERPVGLQHTSDDDVNNLNESMLARLILCRKHFAQGDQVDYWQSATCIGWTRSGQTEGSGCAVVLSVLLDPKTTATIKMQIGAPGDVWCNATRHLKEEVTIDTKGKGNFSVGQASVSVWIKKGSERLLELRSGSN